MLVLDKLLNILVIGYVWPEPNSSAAGKNMLSLDGDDFVEIFSTFQHDFIDHV